MEVTAWSLIGFTAFFALLLVLVGWSCWRSGYYRGVNDVVSDFRRQFTNHNAGKFGYTEQPLAGVDYPGRPEGHCRQPGPGE